MRKRLSLIVLFFALTTFPSPCLFALDLKQALDEIIERNPEILERAENYHFTNKDVVIAEADLKPTIDFTLSTGFENTKSPSTAFAAENKLATESSLTFTQPIFDGYLADNEIKARQATAKAAYYSLKNTMGQTILRGIELYLNLLRASDLLLLSQENRQTHQLIYDQIKERYDNGFGTLSEFQQASGRLALAKSNLAVEENNYMDEVTNLYTVLGRFIDAEEMELPDFMFELPNNLPEMTRKLLKSHPQILEGVYTVESSKHEHERNRQVYWPKVDLSSAYSLSENTGGIDGKTQNYEIKLDLSYNLYNGGSDSENLKKSLHAIHQNTHSLLNVQRQVIERARLSWSAHEKIQEQLEHLKIYVDSTKQQLDSYKEEFRLGRRDLFDMLNVEGEYNDARQQITSVTYALLLSKYRILEAQGILPEMFNYSADAKIRSQLLKGH